MAMLIDADKLMSAFRQYMVEHCDRIKCASEDNCKVCEKGCLWRKVVSESPIVDAVEVVRCKDCIHWYAPGCACLKIYSDGDVSPCAWQFRNTDDFCSYGERRADG